MLPIDDDKPEIPVSWQIGHVNTAAITGTTTLSYSQVSAPYF